jgi:hypothetical protein
MFELYQMEMLPNFSSGMVRILDSTPRAVIFSYTATAHRTSKKTNCRIRELQIQNWALVEVLYNFPTRSMYKILSDYQPSIHRIISFLPYPEFWKFTTGTWQNYYLSSCCGVSGTIDLTRRRNHTRRLAWTHPRLVTGIDTGQVVCTLTCACENPLIFPRTYYRRLIVPTLMTTDSQVLRRLA